jgi:hypothetical protein
MVPDRHRVEPFEDATELFNRPWREWFAEPLDQVEFATEAREHFLLISEVIGVDLLHLRDQRGVARGTYTSHHDGIRFLFVHTLDREWSLFSKKESVRLSASVCPMCRRTPTPGPSWAA